MKGSRCLHGAAAVLLALVFAAPLSAQADKGMVEGETNVQLIFRMGTIENGQKSEVKSYTLVVAEGPVGSKLLAGQRVPFPSSDDGGAIVYQNIGFATEARVWMVGENMIKVVADIEDSRIREGEDGNPPTVETRQLVVSAVLTEGVSLELTRVNGVTDTPGYVELEAKILR